MKNRTRTLLYLGGLLLYLTLDIARYQESGKPNWGFGILFDVYQWLTIYLTHVVVLNPLFARKRYGWAILGGLGCVAFFIGLRYLVDETLMSHLIGTRNYFPGMPFSFFVKDNLYFALPLVLIGLIFKISEDWFVHQQERMALVSERNTAELAFLKSQVNPHFLFNTLNNIYALAYTKSDAAPGPILKLSELMRYMLVHPQQHRAVRRCCGWTSSCAALEGGDVSGKFCRVRKAACGQRSCSIQRRRQY